MPERCVCFIAFIINSQITYQFHPIRNCIFENDILVRCENSLIRVNRHCPCDCLVILVVLGLLFHRPIGSFVLFFHFLVVCVSVHFDGCFVIKSYIILIRVLIIIITVGPHSFNRHILVESRESYSIIGRIDTVVCFLCKHTSICSLYRDLAEINAHVLLRFT